MKSAFAIAGVALALTTGGALAAPVGLGSAPAVDNGIVQVHGIHTSCQHTPRSGWHRSPVPGLNRFCRPGRPSGIWWTWRSDGGRAGWYHRRERRWH
ncbi:MAG: hypothetical protein HOO99_06630 [Hyphomicrobiaceae bacterium]|nr:hypothetical protein [Hyphomicrobiaceae bacterium]